MQKQNLKITQYYIKRAIQAEMRITEIDCKMKYEGTSKKLMNERNENVRNAALFNKILYGKFTNE